MAMAATSLTSTASLKDQLKSGAAKAGKLCNTVLSCSKAAWQCSVLTNFMSFQRRAVKGLVMDVQFGQNFQ